MYDQSPQFNFVGSNMNGLPTTLDQINPAYYNQIAQFVSANGGRLASVCGVVLYDTLRIDAGLLPTKDFNFFQNGVGQSQNLFVAGTTYTKQEIDVTPWVDNGKLSTGYEALIWGIEVIVRTVGSLDESLQTSGNAINLTLDPGIISGEAATDAIKQANVMRAVQEGTYFKLFVNNTTFEDGPAWRFPTSYGIGGGIALAGIAAAPVGDGALNNSLGWAYQMPVMRHLPSLTKFGVKMSVQNPFTLVGNLPLRITVALTGIGIQPITG